MRVDFYVLGSMAPERIVPMLAAKAQGAGQRMLVVARDDASRSSLSDALWQQEGFLAHGAAGEEAEDRQPLLLGPEAAVSAGVDLLCIADGVWRDPVGFARVFYLFGDDNRDAARQVWREMDARDDVEAFFWKQENGKWRQGP